MWSPFKGKRDHELRLAQMQLDQQRLMIEALTQLGSQQATSLEKIGEMVQTIAASQQKSSDVLQTWLEGFKVMEMPQSTTMRDEDEVREAIERTLASDGGILPAIPHDLPAEFQLAWQLKNGFDNEV